MKILHVVYKIQNDAAKYFLNTKSEPYVTFIWSYKWFNYPDDWLKISDKGSKSNYCKYVLDFLDHIFTFHRKKPPSKFIG